MFSKQLLVAVVSLCAFVGAASAGTTKVSAFQAAGPGTTLNPDVDGTGTIKFGPSTGGYTRVHLEISDLTPGVTYSILVEADFGSQFLFDAFTTNPAGHGVLISDDLFNGDLTGNPAVTVFVWDEVTIPSDSTRAVIDSLGWTRAASELR